MTTPAFVPFPNAVDPSPAHASARLRLALGMQRDGIVMMRQNLRRRYPTESPEQIGTRLSQWLAYSPDQDDPRFEVRPCRDRSSNS